MHLKYTEILPTITQENIRNCRQYLWIVRDNIFNNKNSTLQLLFLFYRAVNIYKNAMTASQSIKIKSLFRNRLKLFPEYRRKTSRSKGENQQQTQPTYGVDVGIWTRPHWWAATALTTAPSLPLITAKQQDCPVFTKFLTKKISYQNISNTFSVWFCSNVMIIWAAIGGISFRERFW